MSATWTVAGRPNRSLTEEGARRFADGAPPSWELAWSTLVESRPAVRELVDLVVRAEEPTLIAVTTASAEGKSTCLLQMAARLAERGVLTVLRHGELSALHEFAKHLADARGRICIVVDDAASSELQVLLNGLRSVDEALPVVVAAARDIDWQLSRLPSLDGIADTGIKPINFDRLKRFDVSDAHSVLHLWDALDLVPPELRRLTSEARAAELARRTQRFGGASSIGTQGSLLASLLMAREGVRVARERIRDDLVALDRSHEHLAQGLALLAAADALQIDGLDYALFERAFMELTGNPARRLTDLRSEAATQVGARGNLWGTRHELIAEVVVARSRDVLDLGPERLCSALVDAAEALLEQPLYSREILTRAGLVQHLAPRAARLLPTFAADTEESFGVELASKQQRRHAEDVVFIADSILSQIYSGHAMAATREARARLLSITEYPRWSTGIRSVVQHLSLAVAEGHENVDWAQEALYLSLVALSDQLSLHFVAREVPPNLAGLRRRCADVAFAEPLKVELDTLLAATTHGPTEGWARKQRLEFTTDYARTGHLRESMRAVAQQLSSRSLALDPTLPPIKGSLTFNRVTSLIRRAAEAAGVAGKLGYVGEVNAAIASQQHFRHTVDEWRRGRSAEGIVVEELEVYPEQQAAMDALERGAHVVMATPTGSGKTLVAMWAGYLATSTGRRTVYAAPTRALVHEKFLELREVFGTKRVGLATGDQTVTPAAPILCCTTEIVAQDVVRRPARLAYSMVILDEAHYYADPERGLAWQLPLIHLPTSQFLLMSATLTGTEWLREDLRSRTGVAAELVEGSSRPTELDWEWSEAGVDEATRRAGEDSYPGYLVTFRRSIARERGEAHAHGRRESPYKYEAHPLLESFAPTTPFGHVLKRVLKERVAIHHGGMLPYYRLVVERLVELGGVDLIAGTDTLGVGVNMPIQSVIFSQLWKNFGQVRGGEQLLTPIEFHQIAGRAGRAGKSAKGKVIGVGPEPELGRTGRVRAVSRRNPSTEPPQGLTWSETEFRALQRASFEPIKPTFGYTFDFFVGVLAAHRGEFMSAMRMCNEHHLSGEEAVAVAARVREDARRVIKALRRVPLESMRDYGVIRHRSAFGISGQNRALLFLAVALDALFHDRPPTEIDLLQLCEAAEPSSDVRRRLMREREFAIERGRDDLVAKIDKFLVEPRLAADARAAAEASPLQELGLFDAADYVGTSVVRSLLRGSGTVEELLACGFLDHEDDVREYLRQIDRWLGKWLPFWLQTDALLDLRAQLQELTATLEMSLLDVLF